jgi:hypothetical protein
MIKYFCDTCRIELSESEIKYCHEMIGYGMFCNKHIPEHSRVKYFKKWAVQKKDKYNQHIILCPHCGKDSGYTKEGIMFLYIANDLKCKLCGGIIVISQHYYNAV